MSTTVVVSVDVQSATAAPSVVATKLVSDTSPAPGQNFTYTIRYRCASTFEHCTGATLTDTVPAGQTIISYSGAGGLVTAATKSGQTINWTLKNPLTAGSTGLVTIAVQYPACDAGGFDPAPETNSATFATTNGAPASIVATAPAVDGDPVPKCAGGGPTPPSGGGEFKKDNSGVASPGGAMRWRIQPKYPTGTQIIEDALPAGTTLGFTIVYGFAGTAEAYCNGSWVTLAGPNLTAVGDIPGCPGTGSYLVGDIKFPGVTKLRWTLSSSGGGTEMHYYTWVDPSTPVGTRFENCATYTVAPDPAAPACVTSIIEPGPRVSPQKQLLAVPPSSALSDPYGKFPSGTTLGPNDIEFQASLTNVTGYGQDIVNPVITDLLDTNLEFVPPADGGTNFQVPYSWQYNPIAGSGNVNAVPTECYNPTFSVTENFAGTGRTLLKWVYNGCVVQAGIWESTVGAFFSARIKPTTPAGTIIKNHTENLLLTDTTLISKFCPKNGAPPADTPQTPWYFDFTVPTPDLIDYDGDGNKTEQRCASNEVQYLVPVLANAESSKWVLGALDSTWSRYPASGDTDQTGTRSYELYINNTGNTPLSTIDLIDIMPYIGDTSVTSPATPRGSQWGMQLVSLDSFETVPYQSTTYTAAPTGDYTVGYSTSKNPCRWNSASAADPNRLTISGGVFAGTVDGPAGCTPVTWSDPAAGARSFAVRYTPATPLAPGATFKIGVSVRIQPGEEPAVPITGKIAWNSFGWAASTTAAAPDDLLLSTEPIQVGLKMTDTAATASIGDYVWVDTNHDGVQNEVGTGIAGVTVRLYKAGVLADTTLTDAGGLYRFWGLVPNATDYEVRLNNPADYSTGPLAPYKLTLTNAGDDALDNDASIVSGFADIASTPAGAAGSHTPTYDFGFWQAASLGDYVWEDTNGDGAQQPAELPVVGATVELFTQAGVSLGTTTTDAAGVYLFDNLAPGTYYVVFDKSTATSIGSTGASHSTYRWTTPDATGDETNDSDVNSTGRTPNITLVGGQHDPRWDAGLNPTPLPIGPNSIGDYTWLDLNKDGLQGAPADEPPLAGVIVTLFDLGGARESTTTDAAGFYQFINLPDGDYSLKFEAPPGYRLTQRLNAAEGDNNDSDVYIESGFTDVTTLDNGAAAENDMTWDAGFVPTFSLGNFVWNDVNNSGTFDSGDNAIGGVPVLLYAADGTTEVNVGPDGVLGTADDAPGGVVTNGTGNYLFTNLDAGQYVVKITPPTGYISSKGTASAYEPGANPDTNPTDHDDNGTAAGAQITSGIVTLSYVAEPTGEGATTGWPDATPDANGNYTVDFGIYQPTGNFSIGNRVWFDAGVLANDGIYQKADEAPAAGVELQLWASDAAGAPTGSALATVVTGPGGEYRFDKVFPGTYVVKATAANFAVGAVLEHYQSSTGGSVAYLIADDERDHGVDQASPATTGVLSAVITVDAASMPAAEDETETTYPAGSVTGVDAGDASNNLTVDLGFFAKYDLALIKTTTAAAIVAPNVTIPWSVTVLNQGQLPSGTYTVTDNVPAGLGTPTAISDGGVWSAASHSIIWTVAAAAQLTSNDGLTGGTDEHVFTFSTAIVDVSLAPYRNWAEITADSGNDADSTTGGAIGDDSGADPTTGTQPDDQVFNHDDPNFDNNTSTPIDPADLTKVDEDDNDYAEVGVSAFAIGNLVWFDAVPDGIHDAANALETPVAGAVVQLFKSDGAEVPVGPDGVLGTIDDALGGMTTLANGLYYFDGLAGGDYYVTFTAPVGYSFTTDTPVLPDSINDSNPAPATGQTPVFTLSTTTPVVDTALGDPATLLAAKIDRTIDAGLVVKYSLGNRVWFDTDNSGDMNGTESGIGLVVVNLLHGDGTPVLDALGAAITDTTDASGFYRFDGLLAGDYVVEVSASNFAASQPLEGGLVSTGAAQEADPNTDGDINDNGLDALVAGAIRSGVVTLGPGLSSEPTGEVAAQLSASGQGAVDARGNMTVDFGIYVPTYAIGNIVWFDADRDGLQGVAATEPPVAGATVRLFRSDNTEVPVGSDGVFGTADDAAGGVTTTATGLYYFDDLPAGNYYVTFTAPMGFAFTTNTPATPDAALDSNPDPLTGQTPNFTLGQSLPLVSAVDGDPATLRGARIDRTIDAGLIVGYGLGNRVWFDTDNSGDMNGSETGITGVIVNLLKGDGTPYTVGGTPVTDTTDGLGFYRFDDLPAGDYIVEVAASNFAVGKPLFGGHPSTGAAQEADPNLDVDVNDNGLDALVAGAIRAAAATLGAGLASEPTGEVAAQLAADGQGTVDARANMTVDFGIYVPRYTLGNLVWDDFNNDGLATVGEAPIAGVTLQLLMDDPADPGTLIPAVDADGAPVADQLTGTDGLYEFTNLLEGTYVVCIPTGQTPLAGLKTSGTPNPTAGDDTDGDNNGVAQPDGTFKSGPVVLGPLSSEPTNEVDGLALGTPDQDTTTGDALHNWSVDFGFFRGVRIGNLVWLDGVAGDGATYDNGVVDPGETPLGGVTVELWADDGNGVFDALDAMVDSTSTESEGNYWFENVVPGGKYFIGVPTFAGPTLGLGARSSTGQSAGPDAADNDDDGAPNATHISMSALFTAPAVGAAPTAESDTIPATDGSAETEASLKGHTYPDVNSDLRLDFGFVEVPLYRLGNLVWIDVNKNGIAEDGEAPLSGVRVELYNSTGLFSGFAITGTDGKYLFENLTMGVYEVRLPTGQAVLAGYFSSPVDEANADLDGDNNDDGALDVTGAYYSSGPVTLGNGDLADEPTTEVDGLVAANGDDDLGTPVSADDRSNLTVDFGFYQPRFALGNEVWFDLDDSGTINNAEAYVPDGVIVNLLDSAGMPVLDGAGTAVTTTTVGGKYVFDDLLAGSYIVEIGSANFDVGGLLEGYSSSTGQTTGDALTDDRKDHGDDDTTDGVQSAVTALTEGVEPAGENPNSETTAPDANANMTIDFGIVARFSLGNEVWIDLDDSGTINNGEAYVADGVVVNLLHTDGTAVLDAAGVAMTTTTVSGLYLFDDLLAGDYVVELAASNFAPGGLLVGYRSSTLNAGDTQTDQDDNGATHASGAVRTGTITLGGVGAEPTAENPTSPTTTNDANSDLTVDFGVVPMFAIGNEVWIDVDDSGLLDNGETYVPDGVRMNLLHGDGTPVLDAAGVAITASTLGGKYVFDNLVAGSYIVEVDASNFSAIGLLKGYRSSTFNGTDNQADQDDNGSPAAGGSIRSAVIQLGPIGAEPVSETPTSTTAAVDNNGDLTVDFGIVPVFAIGNEVWLDTDDSGILDNGEVYVPDGVVMNLLHADGTPMLNGAGTPLTTTTVTGRYQFDNLLGGDYVVELAMSNFAVGGTLEGYRSSTGQTAGDAVAGEQHDHGDDIETNGVWSTVITLSHLAEPSGETPNETTIAADANANMTIDFGVFRPTFSLGNQIWFDLNDNGIIDPTEPVVPDGTVVNLFKADGTPAGTTTTTGGLYLFANLNEGMYYVELLRPVGYRSSTPTETGDVDQRDHGNDATNGAVAVIRSVTIELLEGTEPVAENPDNDPVTKDANENLTVDLGMVPLLSLGNEVWFDVNDNGVIDNGESYVPDGVKINLLHADGTPVVIGGVAASTTTIGGLYLFGGLLTGDYIVEIDPTNLALGAPLDGWGSSTGQTTDDTDHADHGAPAPNGGIRTAVVTLGFNSEPIAELPSNDAVTPDANSNLTVDLGLSYLAIGNRVWIDVNNNGLRDADEPGVGGVLVELWAADASGPLGSGPIAVRRTDSFGYYLFTGLAKGTYVVRIPASELTNHGALFGYISTQGNGAIAPSPTNGVDDDDNGTQDPTAGWVQSLPFSVMASAAPSGEADLASGYSQTRNGVAVDANIDLTIDFGFVATPPLSLGNRVWFDDNNNGVMDVSEAPVNGVTVQLFRDTNADGVPDTSTPFQSTTTAIGGYYLFTGLAAGKYIVVIPASNFAPDGPLADTVSSSGSHLANDDIDMDDSGIEPGSSVQDVRSSTVTLSYYGEPTGETQIGTEFNSASDINTNLTVDFGFYRLGALGDFVWIDTNRDGKQDATEVGVDGVTIKLYDSSGTLVATTTTAGGGRYLFDNLLAGTYTVEFVLSTIPVGYLPTAPGVPGTDEANDSDGDVITGRTTTFTVTPGGLEPRVDLGIYRAQIDLAISKTVEGEVVAGRNSIWKLVVSNAGLDAETGTITVVDQLPSQLTFVEVTGAGWNCSASGQVVTCTTDADLPAGTSLPTITVTAKVAEGATGEVINTARVSSPGGDTIEPNNSVSKVAPIVKGGTLPGTGAQIGGLLALAGLLLGLGMLARRTQRRKQPLPAHATKF